MPQPRRTSGRTAPKKAARKPAPKVSRTVEVSVKLRGYGCAGTPTNLILKLDGGKVRAAVESEYGNSEKFSCALPDLARAIELLTEQVTITPVVAPATT